MVFESMEDMMGPLRTGDMFGPRAHEPKKAYDCNHAQDNEAETHASHPTSVLPASATAGGKRAGGGGASRSRRVAQLSPRLFANKLARRCAEALKVFPAMIVGDYCTDCRQDLPLDAFSFNSNWLPPSDSPRPGSCPSLAR